MFYKAIHFDIKELVDRDTYNRYGENAWMFLNPAALQMLDGLRDFFGCAVIVNNWHTGGPFQYRGFRSRFCNIGGDYSQHRFGNAFDCDIQGWDAEAVRQKILMNKDNPLLKNITRLESDVNWLHVDCANSPDRIRIVRPV